MASKNKGFSFYEEVSENSYTGSNQSSEKPSQFAKLLIEHKIVNDKKGADLLLLCVALIFVVITVLVLFLGFESEVLPESIAPQHELQS